MTQYNIIAQAIGIISLDPKRNFTLEELALELDLTPTSLQKTFSEWAGISPKQFQRFLSLEYAKSLLKQNKTNLQTTLISGLSSSGRLYDLFVDREAMTPGEFKNGGQNLVIHYSIHDSPFGLYLVASTDKGICNILFLDNRDLALLQLQARWSNAQLINKQVDSHQPVIEFMNHKDPARKIKLHLHGTNYQLKVWQALLTIPEGKITSYGEIAKSIGDNSGLGARAAGTAIGNNPIGYLIPCHRVLQSTGAISGYRWGVVRKKAMMGWEGGKNN